MWLLPCCSLFPSKSAQRHLTPHPNLSKESAHVLYDTSLDSTEENLARKPQFRAEDDATELGADFPTVLPKSDILVVNVIAEDYVMSQISGRVEEHCTGWVVSKRVPPSRTFTIVGRKAVENYRRHDAAAAVFSEDQVSYVAEQTSDYGLELFRRQDDPQKKGGQGKITVRGFFSLPDTVMLVFQDSDQPEDPSCVKTAKVAFVNLELTTDENGVNLLCTRDKAQVFVDRRPLSVILLWKHPEDQRFMVGAVKDLEPPLGKKCCTQG